MSTQENSEVIGKDSLGRFVKDLSKISWWGMDRKEIAWYPTIDYNKCATCGVCFVTCGRMVFDFDVKDKKVVVAHPYNCLVGCQTCANLCPTGAISFPDPSYVKTMVAKNKVVKKAFEKICHLLPEDRLSEEETRATFDKR